MVDSSQEYMSTALPIAEEFWTNQIAQLSVLHWLNSALIHFGFLFTVLIFVLVTLQ